MAEQATIDQLRALLGQLTAEQDQQRAQEQNAKRDDDLSPADRIKLIRAEQALNGRSVSGEQLEHVLRILEGLTSDAPTTSQTTAQQRIQPTVGGDVPPATEQQPQNTTPTEYAGLIGV